MHPKFSVDVLGFVPDVFLVERDGSSDLVLSTRSIAASQQTLRKTTLADTSFSVWFFTLGVLSMARLPQLHSTKGSCEHNRTTITFAAFFMYFFN